MGSRNMVLEGDERPHSHENENTQSKTIRMREAKMLASCIGTGRCQNMRQDWQKWSGIGEAEVIELSGQKQSEWVRWRGSWQDKVLILVGLEWAMRWKRDQAKLKVGTRKTSSGMAGSLVIGWYAPSLRHIGISG